MKRFFALLLIFGILTLSACNNITSDIPIDTDTSTEVTSPDITDEATDVITSPFEEASTHDDNTDIKNECNGSHRDTDNNGLCDECNVSVIIILDLFAINDLHGKFNDTESNVGIDELTTYLKNAQNKNKNTILLSSGDMWQGSSESNLTKGMIMTDWMNELDFASMTLGNHEYDWGEDIICENADIADFPFLAINVFDKDTNKRVDYCDSSVVIDLGEIQIGIIGAMGDCYSSIASDKSDGVYFKVGSELTALVKNESDKLRSEGVDYIIYSLHDGYSSNTSGSLSSSKLSSYYDSSLSSGGYVDMVFEGHTHKNYVITDSYGVHHMQNGGDNNGISYAQVSINFANFNSSVESAKIVSYKEYSKLDDHPIVDELLEKYKDEISKANEVLGNISKTLYSDEIRQLVADLYYEFGLEKWGDEYDIVLGGGFLNCRSPYNIYSGEVKYSDVQSVLPFDNHLVLCSIKGKDLKSKFFETNNSSYFIGYGEYGESVKKNIDINKTYYVVVDTYTSTYKYNNLTEIERITDDLFARDLLAEYIKEGRLK